MRIVSYNILDGGVGRADPLAEVILAQTPDLVAIVEADDVEVLDRLARRLKMDFIHAPGNMHASALFSRWPIQSSINHALLSPQAISRSLLEATVVDPDGQSWIVGVLHLHSRAFEADEQKREGEIGKVLEIFSRHRNQHLPHLICGDFNSNAPWQQIDPAQCKSSTQRAWEANGGKLPRRVIQKMLDAGYSEALNSVNPTDAATRCSFSTLHPGQRVDYVFTHGIERSRLRSARVEQDRLAQFASDHYPICAEIV